jgi:DeoR/GlpR family transcriptional regulator of sugar metabolism
MLKRERQVYILHQVNLDNKVLCADLSQHINVSDSPSFLRGHHSSKDVYSYQQKKIIAQKAASLIKDGMYVLTSGGNTIIEVARGLPPTLNATFISGSIPAIFEYMNHPNINVIVIGDKISKIQVL